MTGPQHVRLAAAPSTVRTCDTDGCTTPSLGGGRWCWPHYAAGAHPRAPSRIGHGSPAGYARHLRSGTDPCLACTAAHTTERYGGATHRGPTW